MSIAPRAKRLLLAIPVALAALSLTLCTNPTFIEFTRYVAPTAIRPTGFDSDLQWNMEMINAPGAWAVMEDLANQGVSFSPVSVAVVDTGVFADHSAFGGRVDVANSRDLWQQCDPGDDPDIDPCDHSAATIDSNGHGTHVAGIVAALSGEPSLIRISGVAVEHVASVIALKVLPNSGSGSVPQVTDSLIQAFHDLVDLLIHQNNTPVRVVTLSLGGGPPDPLFYDAINRAVQVGVSVVAAAGNTGQEGLLVPAAFDNTIAVGSVGANSSKPTYSSYGYGLDFAAPGGARLMNSVIGEPRFEDSIASTHNVDDQYRWLTGTSMATPHVAGVAALLYAVEPGLNQAAVYSILRATARDLGAPGWDKYYGHGLVDAQAALEYLVNLRRRIPRAPMGQEPGGGSGGLRINVAALSGAQLPPPEAEIDAATLIVRFADGTDSSDSLQLQAFADAVADRLGPTAVRAVGADTAVVELLAGQSVVDALQQVAGVTGVQFSQPNYIYRAVW